MWPRAAGCGLSTHDLGDALLLLEGRQIKYEYGALME